MKPNIIIKSIMIAVILFINIQLSAQSAKSKIGIISIEAQGWKEAMPIAQLVRIELGKLNLFEVIDRYDIEDIMRKNNLNPKDCRNKECILQTGKLIEANFMLSGSVEKINSKILVMFREMDVKLGSTLKTITKEFPDGENATETLIEVTLKEMYGIPVTEQNKQSLENKNKIANGVNNPNQSTVSIGGPRFGFSFLTGNGAEFMTRSKEQGGYAGYPALFQFGYQFEKMYLSEGNLQALFEFLPTISGVDQGHFIPSFTLLNGFRSTKNGWEFAFGPTITWTKTIDSYKDDKGVYHFVKDYQGYDSAGKYHRLPYEIESRNDTRGEITAKPGLLIGFGKTFKTGKLNMPLNFYIIPRKSSFQFGVSYGFNTMRKVKD